METQVENSIVHKTRWGYVPCDYETYLKIKELCRLYWKEFYLRVPADAAWERWARKEPQNRVIIQKICNPERQAIGKIVVGPMPEPTTYYPKQDWADDSIPSEYKKARMPVKKLEDVPDMLWTVEEIDALLKKAKEWEASLV